MATTCDHDHGGSEGPSGPALTRAVSNIEARLGAMGERLTDPRRRVLELLLAAGRPVKAYDLISDYGRDGSPAKPPTVYRALDFLERTGLVHRISSISAYVACAHGKVDHTAAFLICDCCGDTREITTPTKPLIEASAATAGYRLDRVTVEAHGLCAACQAT